MILVIKVLNVNVFLQIIVIFTFISTTIFAHPHSSNDLWAHPHTHPQNENDLNYNPDKFKDFDLQSSNPSSNNNSAQSQEKKKLILFDNNFYLLDDDFGFGTEEIELLKMELNKDVLETAKEYENFLNVFFNESNYIGGKTYNPKPKNNGSIDRLNEEIKTFEYERRLLNLKIENLEKQLRSTEDIINSSSSKGLGVSAILGGTIPIKQRGFGLGPNVGIRLESPASFNLVGLEANVGIDFYTSMMLGNKRFFLHNIIGNISISPISSMEIRSGLGFTMAYIGKKQKLDLSIPVDLTYYLPIDLSGYKIGLSLLNQVTIGHPIKKGTTSFMNVSLVVKTPLRF